MFFQHYVSDGAMAIFCVAEQDPSMPSLPSYVEFEPQATSQSLASLVGRQNLIEENSHEASTTNSYR
ncbi:MAG: hypothetical protein DDT26_00583 [Dehalococcoidia bacterium]|nr:hypothetical protein [Chloroflexota bacterium]